MKLKFCILWLCMIALCAAGSPNTALSGKAPLPEKKGPEAREMAFAMLVESAPNDVRAFGFDLVYPADLMKFEGAEKGALAKKGFSLFGANEVAPGRVRIGGVATTSSGLKRGASGELVILTFKGFGEKQPAFRLVNQKDDVAAWSFSAQANGSAALVIRRIGPPETVKKNMEQ